MQCGKHKIRSQEEKVPILVHQVVTIGPNFHPSVIEPELQVSASAEVNFHNLLRAATPIAMLWRSSSSCMINNVKFASALHLGARTARYSPCTLRSITTQPSQVVQARENTSTEESWKTRREGDTSRGRQAGDELFANKQPRTRTLYARCAELLTPDRNSSDPQGPNSYTNKTVSVNGTVKTIRKQKHGAFAHLTDGSCVQPIQVVLDPELAAP